MESHNAIRIVRAQAAAIAKLEGKKEDDPAFIKWHRDTMVALQKIFGPNAKHASEFNRIDFHLTAWYQDTEEAEYQEAYEQGLRRAAAFLESIVSELEIYGEEPASRVDAVQIILHLFDRFHIVARQLRERHSSRPTLDIDDEYDVQDLVHALLKLEFDDVRKEEWCPSYAGGASRMDFLVKEEQIVLETKKSRKGLDARRLGDELLVDMQRYQSHPDCKRLICLVYDPEGRIANPRGIEADLTGGRSGIDVIVKIVPTGQ